MSSVTSSGIGVKTIDHITIVVKDLERSAQFYAELLAMESIQRPDFGFSGLWFQAGGTRIHMNVEGKEAGSAGFSPQDAECASRGFHYAFEVEDCDVAADLIKKQGIEIVEGPQSRQRCTARAQLRRMWQRHVGRGSTWLSHSNMPPAAR